MATPAGVRDAFSFKDELECFVIIVKPVDHAWRVYSKVAVHTYRAATRRSYSPTQEPERQDGVIANVKPEELILVDEMPNNNGEDGAAVAAEDSHDGPVVDNDPRILEGDDHMAVAEEEVVIRDGAGFSSDT